MQNVLPSGKLSKVATPSYSAASIAQARREIAQSVLKEGGTESKTTNGTRSISTGLHLYGGSGSESEERSVNFDHSVDVRLDMSKQLSDISEVEEAIKYSIRNKWWPAFKDEAIERSYLEYAWALNLQYWGRVWWIAVVMFALFWAPFLVRTSFQVALPDVFFFGILTLQCMILISMPVLTRMRHVCMEGDTKLCGLLSGFLVVSFFSNTYRIGALFAGDLLYFYGDRSDNTRPSDVNMLLTFVMVITFAFQFFHIRARRCWPVALIVCITYGATSLPAGLSPHPMQETLQSMALILLVGIIAWLGRCRAEMQERGNWYRKRLLTDEVTDLAHQILSMSNQTSPEEEYEGTLWKTLSDSLSQNRMSQVTRTIGDLRMFGHDHEIIEAEMRVMRKRISEEAGVSVAYLLSPEFKAMVQGATGKKDPTFYDISDSFFLMGHHESKNMICPRDGKRGCALVDTLQPEHRGRATHFLSWLWRYSLSTVRSALVEWMRSAQLDPSKVFLYMCFFVNNQYRLLDTDSMVDAMSIVPAYSLGSVGIRKSGVSSGVSLFSDDLEMIFETNLKRIKQLVAILDDWDSPAYLNRIWTIFEQLTAIRLGISVTMVLPPKAAESLIRQFEAGQDGILRVKDALSSIDSESAQASFPDDEVRVKSIIERTEGFAAVNRKVSDFMIEWVAMQLCDWLNRLVHSKKVARSTSSLTTFSVDLPQEWNSPSDSTSQEVGSSMENPSGAPIISSAEKTFRSVAKFSL